VIEEFFRARRAEVFHEVCPLADPSVFELIRACGYKRVEFSNVLYRPIDPDLRLNASRNEQIKSGSSVKMKSISGRKQRVRAGATFPKLLIFKKN
jgi:hypothetical protein